LSKRRTGSITDNQERVALHLELEATKPPPRSRRRRQDVRRRLDWGAGTG
jgi:hypothetical protein